MSVLSWEEILVATAGTAVDLKPLVDALLDQQRKTWRAFREGEAALARLKTKRLVLGGASVIVQANPGRHASVHAKVDPEEVSRRPCFLCREAMPPEERGVGFGELVLFPNPHPIVPRHLTVPIRAHRPQQLDGRVEVLLELARALGPEMFVLYNGARCGASAPDHFHFQACTVEGVPLLEPAVRPDRDGGFEVAARTSFGRRMLVLRSPSAARLEDRLYRLLETLSTLMGTRGEPPFNLIVLWRNEHCEAFFFPRSKHRPDCYFAEEASRVAVSPGALEMSGVVVVAEPDHFERVDEQRALSIFEEVSLEPERFQRLVEAVT